jgi:anti-sigma B factor antagonist
MNLQVTTSNDYTIVSIEGRVDTTTANEFEKLMTELLDGGTTRLILDCSGLSYISSSGLRVFLIVLKKMKSTKGLFRLCNLQPVIQGIFEVSGFTSIFAIFPDLTSAQKN